MRLIAIAILLLAACGGSVSIEPTPEPDPCFHDCSLDARSLPPGTCMHGTLTCPGADGPVDYCCSSPSVAGPKVCCAAPRYSPEPVSCHGVDPSSRLFPSAVEATISASPT